MDGRSWSGHPDTGGTPRPRGTLLLLLLVFFASAPASHAAAQDRLSRSFDARDGLTAATVFSLAQDSTGFLWIGTVGGLYRYDGAEMRRWAPDAIQGRVFRLAVLGSGRVMALEEAGELWRVEDAGARRVEGPDGRPFEDVLDLARGRGEALWILERSGRIWRRNAGRWRSVPDDAFGGERPDRIVPGARGGLEVATGEGVWHLPRRGPPERLASVRRVVDILALPDGRRYVLTFWRHAYLLEDGELRDVADVRGRGIDLALRDGVVWISYDRYLARAVPGEETRVLGPAEGIGDGGPLLVDHEGSLWMGTLAGLRQFPEPETLRWSDAHGLPSDHARFLARAGDTIWVTTWQGAARITGGAGGWRADTARGWITRSEVAVDGEGDAWFGTEGGLIEVRHGRDPWLGLPGVRGVVSVDDAGEDRLWMGVYSDVVRVRTAGFGGAPSARIDTVGGLDFPDGARVQAVFEDSRGRLWVGARERICRADADRVLASDAPGWTCRTFPDAVHFSDFHETGAGSIWAASPYAGILRYRRGAWEPVAAVGDLPSRAILRLEPSRSGGVWVLGHGVVRRVEPDPSAPGGWRELELVSAWHGLPTNGARDLLEDPDGGLWITTSRGLVRIPARVRHATAEPPRVALVEARVDDERLPLRAAPALPHDRNRLELRFAALSYRAPTAVRYQVRLTPGSGWSDARSQPVVRWVDLDPADYRVEVRASLDGERWSEPSASFAFSVLPPWYLEPRWLVVFALGLLLVGLLAYRARVAHLVGLERQRTRIAMDLHDEMGAALGSVGIQAGMLARPDVAGGRRRRLAEEIADTVGVLGGTLADIVWSLDPRASTLQDLALRLEERGRRLFVDSRTELQVAFPDAWPPGELSPPVRRNVLMVGLEALNNAADHAGADRVRLSLGRVRRGEWRMVVRDDGVGLAAADVHDEGLGLLSMKKRAREMGAELAWRRPDAGGTEVALTFRIRGDRSPADRLRSAWWRLRDRMNMLLRRD